MEGSIATLQRAVTPGDPEHFPFSFWMGAFKVTLGHVFPTLL